MKKIILLAYVVVAFIALPSCSKDKKIKPSGDIISETFDLASFKSIVVENGIDVIIQQGNTQKVELKTDNNIMEYVEIQVESGALSIGIRDNVNILSDRTIEMNIVVDTLNSIIASGGSFIDIPQIFSAENINLSLSGGSLLNGIIETEDATVNCSGGSIITLSGETEKIDVLASGGSVVSAYDFIADDVFLELSGGCVAEVFVNNTLSVVASGGSSVSYKGNGSVVSQVLTGGSTINKK